MITYTSHVCVKKMTSWSLSQIKNNGTRMDITENLWLGTHKMTLWPDLFQWLHWKITTHDKHTAMRTLEQQSNQYVSIWSAVYCVYTVTADNTSLNKDSDCYCCVTDGYYFTLFFKLCAHKLFWHYTACQEQSYLTINAESGSHYKYILTQYTITIVLTVPI